MAYRKHYSKPATKSVRFRIERTLDDKRFLVLDGLAGTYAEYATLQEAETECDKLKDALRPKTSEPPELPVLREKLRKEGFLTPEESAVLDRPRDKDLKPVRPRRDPQISIDQMRKALPALCRDWGCELTRQAGIDDERRRKMTTDEVIAAIGLADSGGFSAQFNLETLAEEFRELRLTCLEDEGFRGVVAVNYLSSEPARFKARYLGISERDYFRQLAEGHRWLARCVAAKYDYAIDLDPTARDAMRDIEDRELRADVLGRSTPDDDGDCCGLNPGDLFGFTVEKW
jgi:hypothetical protein